MTLSTSFHPFGLQNIILFSIIRYFRSADDGGGWGNENLMTPRMNSNSELVPWGHETVYGMGH